MGEWRDFNLPDGSYSDETRPWTQQDVCNYLPTFAEGEGTRSRLKLATAPGLRLKSVVGTGPHRGARDVEGKRFVVSGNKLYQVASTGVSTELGTIPGTRRVSMTHNQVAGGNQLVIATGDNSYVYDTAAGTLVATGIPLVFVDFLNQLIVGVDVARRFWRYSGLADALSWNTLDNESAESSPDRIVGLIVSQGEVLIFGERTIEVWSNSPTDTTAFQRTEVIEKGCANGHTIQRLDNTVFFVGNDFIPYRLNGYQPVPIASKAISTQLGEGDPSKLFANTYEDRGYVIYYVTAQDGRTWGYDVTCQRWHRRESFGLDRWRINTLFRWNGAWWAGDYSNGNLYELEWGLAYENDTIFPRYVRSGVMHRDGNRVFIHALRLTANTGASTASTDPTADLSIAGGVPDYAVGDAASGAYTAAGGIPPYAFAVTAGAFPTGLALATDGAYSGTANTGGEYSWTVTVTDADGNTATLDDASTVAGYVFFAVSAAKTEGSYARSPDGLDWSAALLKSDVGDFSGAARLASAADGKILLGSRISSDKGATWGDSNGFDATNFRIIHTGTAFLISCTLSHIRRSTDGVTFSTATAPDVPGHTADNLKAIAARADLVVACGYWPHLSVDDGVTWTSPTGTFVFGASEDVSALGCDGATFVAGSILGGLKSSTDGLAWAAITSPFTGTPTVTAIKWTNGIWVAGTDAGELAYSTDGATWALASSTFGGAVASIYAANGLFVAVGAGGTIATSTDGDNWTDRANTFGGDDIDDVTAYIEAP